MAGQPIGRLRAVSWADVRAELTQRGTELDRSRDRGRLLGHHVFLGWLVLHEPTTVQILVAAAILGSVALIVSAAGAAGDRISGEDRRAKVEPELGFEG
jgi:hypothetical protein